VRAYYHQLQTTYSFGYYWLADKLTIEPGPLGGVFHEETGNLVFAMGWDGVLVRTPDDKWRWVDVGEYYHLRDLSSWDELSSILRLEMFVAIALFSLVFTSSTALIRRSHNWFKFGEIGLGWGDAHARNDLWWKTPTSLARRRSLAGL
jgi:hypothetical protein